MTDLKDRLKTATDLFETRIKKRDALHLDSSERATCVQEFLFTALDLSDKDSITNPLFWDLLTYFKELFLIYAMQSQEEFALKLAKELNNYLMSHHYSVPDGHAILGPSREEHIEIWQGRIDALKKEASEE